MFSFILSLAISRVTVKRWGPQYPDIGEVYFAANQFPVEPFNDVKPVPWWRKLICC